MSELATVSGDIPGAVPAAAGAPVVSLAHVSKRQRIVVREHPFEVTGS